MDVLSSLPYSQPFCASGISTVMMSPRLNCKRVRLEPAECGAIAWTFDACVSLPPLLTASTLPAPCSPKELERERWPAESEPARS